jgi:serine/threonine protein kinase
MSLKAGDRLGDYTIMGVINEGGTSVVYSAEHVWIARKVAVKVLRPNLVRDKQLLRRFLREARVVNRVNHPNIVKVYDLVEQTDRDPPLIGMVMEALQGQDLADRLDTELVLDPEQAVVIAAQVADALSALHQVQILHRDIKPENIFLEDHPHRKISVKLLDLGIAKVLGGPSGSMLTAAGVTIGTPLYMAPEQVLDRELDGRADIYGLGTTLYEMLAGTAPFSNVESLGDIVVCQVKEPAPRLADRRLSRPPIPDSLEALVMCCLEKEPDRRFQSASALHKALLASLSELEEDTLDQPIQLADELVPSAATDMESAAESGESDHPAMEAAVRSWRLNRRWFITGLIVIAIAGSGILGWSLVSQQEPAVPRQQESSEVDAGTLPPSSVAKRQKVLSDASVPADGKPPGVDAVTAAKLSGSVRKMKDAKKISKRSTKKRRRPAKKKEDLSGGTIDPF